MVSTTGLVSFGGAQQSFAKNFLLVVVVYASFFPDFFGVARPSGAKLLCQESTFTSCKLS